MERAIPKRNKSVKFSPGTSEDGSGDEAARIASRIRKPARPQRPGHLSIQHGLSNAHLVLRRYAALDGFGAGELSDDEQEILNSPKVAPTQPVDRCCAALSLLRTCQQLYSIKASCIQSQDHGSAMQLCKHIQPATDSAVIVPAAHFAPQAFIFTLHMSSFCLKHVMHAIYLLHLDSQA